MNVCLNRQSLHGSIWVETMGDIVIWTQITFFIIDSRKYSEQKIFVKCKNFLARKREHAESK